MIKVKCLCFGNSVAHGCMESLIGTVTYWWFVVFDTKDLRAVRSDRLFQFLYNPSWDRFCFSLDGFRASEEIVSSGIMRGRAG